MTLARGVEQKAQTMSERLRSSDADADQLAMDRLAREKRTVLLRYFNRKGFRPPDDEEAVQEVFLRLTGHVARHEGKLARVDRLDRYLFAAAAHVAIDLRRKDAVRAGSRHDSYDDSRHARADHDPEAVLMAREALDVLVMALNELPHRTSTIFVLARLEHMKHREIAQRLDVTVRCVEQHLHKALAYLGRRVRQS